MRALSLPLAMFVSDSSVFSFEECSVLKNALVRTVRASDCQDPAELSSTTLGTPRKHLKRRQNFTLLLPRKFHK